MKLKALSLYGYRGVSFDPGLVLTSLGQHNVFIGPNNGGKSTVFRALHFLRDLILSGNLNNLFCVQSEINGDTWWMQKTDRDITAEFLFSQLPTEMKKGVDIPEKLAPNDEWSIRLSLHLQSDGKACLIMSSIVNDGEERHPVVKLDPASEKITHLNANNTYISSHAKDNCPYHQPTFNLMQAWAHSMRFFDPVRAIDRGSGSRGMDDGAALLSDLFNQQQDTRQTARHSMFTDKLASYINRLMKPGTQAMGSIESLQLKGTSEKPQMYLKERGSTGPPIALESMGTGIAELIILLSSLVKDLINNPSKPLQYFIEEPEVHLHPGLLRRFLKILKEFPNIQFFISSHSNIVLDVFCKNQDRIFLFSQCEQGYCTAIPCMKVIEQQQILDSLGVTGSSLLQTNCVIWVEGPSDRMYIRNWLNIKNPELEEGTDYTFAFYGGKILSHFCFDNDNNQEALDDFLSVIDVCRFSAIIMDRDIAPNKPNEEIRATKRRIYEEAQRDPTHRKALFTEGREIENDLPIEIFRTVVEEFFGQSSEVTKNITLTGNKRYTEETVLQLKLTDKNAETLKNKLENKVALAREILKRYPKFPPETTVGPQYISTLAQFISSSCL